MFTHTPHRTTRARERTVSLQCAPFVPQVPLSDSHPLVWPLESGWWVATCMCGTWTPGHGHPRFKVAPPVGVMDSNSVAWTLEIG